MLLGLLLYYPDHRIGGLPARERGIAADTTPGSPRSRPVPPCKPQPWRCRVARPAVRGLRRWTAILFGLTAWRRLAGDLVLHRPFEAEQDLVAVRLSDRTVSENAASTKPAATRHGRRDPPEPNATMATIRLLTFSTLYPNNARPNHGIFVENRLRHLVASRHAHSSCRRPVPWFPSRSPLFGRLGAARQCGADRDCATASTVHHPRYPVIPRIGMSAAPYLLYRATLPALRRLLGSGQRFDAIDAHYVYPDGVAAVWLGQALGLPTVVTARGTDINLIPRYLIPRVLIRRAIAGAAALIAVSAALKTELVALGAPRGQGDRPAQRRGCFAVPAGGSRRGAQRTWAHAADAAFGGPSDRAQGTSPDHRGYDAVAGIRPPHRRRRPATRPACRLDRSIGSGRARQAAGRAAACRIAVASTARPTSWCWPPVAKAGRTYCWKRWPAARRSLPATSGATRKSCATRRPV